MRDYRLKKSANREKEKDDEWEREMEAKINREVDRMRMENQEKMKELRMKGEQLWLNVKKRREKEGQRESRQAQDMVQKFNMQQKREKEEQLRLVTRQEEVIAEEQKKQGLVNEHHRRSEERRKRQFLAPNHREQNEREAQLNAEHHQSVKSKKSRNSSAISWKMKKGSIRQAVQVETYNQYHYLPQSSRLELVGDESAPDEEISDYSDESSSSEDENESDADSSSSSEVFTDEEYSSEEYSDESISLTDDKEMKTSNGAIRKTERESFTLESEFELLSLSHDKDKFVDIQSSDISSDNNLEFQKEFAKCTEFVQEVISIVFEMQPIDDYLDIDWLESVQVQMLWYYSIAHRLSPMEREALLHNLTNIQSNLTSSECLLLTKAVCMLNSCDPFEFDVMPTSLINNPTSQFLGRIIHCGFLLDCPKSLCMERCLKVLVSVTVDSAKLQEFVTQTTTWSTYDRYMFLQFCNLKCVPYEHQIEILHIVQVYNVPPKIVSTFSHTTNPLDALRSFARSEHEKDLESVMQEIRATGLIEQDTLDLVSRIVTKVDCKLLSVIKLDYRTYLTSSSVQRAQSALKSCVTSNVFDIEEISDAIVTLACAVKDKKPFCPRMTQLIALTVLIVSHTKSTNRLLEVLTGEGKSCIIAMFAAVLGIQGKNVDIITSSPILAERDADEWKEYYEIFELEVADNSNLEGGTSPLDIDDQRRQCYGKQIVYGTISNFAADILREEFEQKEIRCSRKFDAVIADEVDLLMLDEGIQLTYLSHHAALLHHLEPVLAAVWSVAGQYIYYSCIY